MPGQDPDRTSPAAAHGEPALAAPTASTATTTTSATAASAQKDGFGNDERDDVDQNEDDEDPANLSFLSQDASEPQAYDRIDVLPSKRLLVGGYASTMSPAENDKERATQQESREAYLNLLLAQSPTTDSYRALGKLCIEENLDPALADKAMASRMDVGMKLPSPIGELNIFVSTWNVGNALPDKDEFQSWLPKRNTFDVVAIGFQECEYKLSAEMVDSATVFSAEQTSQKAHQQKHNPQHSVHLKSSSSKSLKPQSSTALVAQRIEDGVKSAMTSMAGSHLASLILEHLGSDLFFMVGQSQLMQMRLFVFARREHQRFIFDVESASEGTGVGGMGGNKGGVAVTFRYNHTRLCFVSVHLAAHRKYAAHRNRDCEVILGMVQRKLAPRYASYQVKFDHVFFFGDVNSRLVSKDDPDAAHPLDVDEGVSEAEKKRRNAKADHTPSEREACMEIITNQRYSELLALDQLRISQSKNRCLNGFVEAAEFTFPPTFKVAREAGYAYDHKRLPAYCDRILYYSQRPGTLKQIDLWSDGWGTTTSDHKPVSSVFLLEAMHLERGRSGKLGAYKLVISNLECKNLVVADMSGASDPYLVLYSEVFNGSSPSHPAARTKVRFQTVNPVFKGQRLTATLGDHTLEEVKGAFAVLQVWDFDTLSHDDPMGEVLLSFDDLVEAYEQNMRFTISETQLTKRASSTLEQRGECTFDLPVIFHGRGAGRMTGVARLVPGGRALDLVSVQKFFGGLCCWKVQAFLEQCGI